MISLIIGSGPNILISFSYLYSSFLFLSSFSPGSLFLLLYLPMVFLKFSCTATVQTPPNDSALVFGIDEYNFGKILVLTYENSCKLLNVSLE